MPYAMIIIAILAAMVVYLLSKKVVTWGDVYTSIKPYYVGGYWWTGTEWESIYINMPMADRREYQITVSQNCTLDWKDYHFDLVTGSNTIRWMPTE